jgi:hypothetical protein
MSGQDWIGLKLHHIGEPLVAKLLQNLEAAGRLSSLACERTNVSVEDDIAAWGLQRPIEFLPERASLAVSASKGQLICDGAQKVDVLCASSGQRAIAFELKLGETLLGTEAFQNRFVGQCSTSHAGSLLTGSMISVLDRRFSESESAILRASVNTLGSWEVVRPWWLVVRNTVWTRWKNSGIPTLNSGRILVLEKVIRAAGGEDVFNGLVRELLCGNFFKAWQMGIGERSADPME